jgi:hypothetical protein
MLMLGIAKTSGKRPSMPVTGCIDLPSHLPYTSLN